MDPVRRDQSLLELSNPESALTQEKFQARWPILEKVVGREYNGRALSHGPVYLETDPGEEGVCL